DRGAARSWCQQAVVAGVRARRGVRSLEILAPLLCREGVAGGGADPLDSRVDVQVPYPGCAVLAPGGQGGAIRAERYGLDHVRLRRERLAERSRMRWIAQAPQPHL